jgi:hypothetical protein
VRSRPVQLLTRCCTNNLSSYVTRRAGVLQGEQRSELPLAPARQLATMPRRLIHQNTPCQRMHELPTSTLARCEVCGTHCTRPSHPDKVWPYQNEGARKQDNV